MDPQQPHFPGQNRRDTHETPAMATQHTTGQPSLPQFDEAPTVTPRTPTFSAPTIRPPSTTRPAHSPARRVARPTVPIRPPTLPGLEDEVRTADAEVRSMALITKGAHDSLAPTQDERKTSALLIRGAAKPPRPAGRVVPRRNGPRSFLVQFLVAMLASIVLVSTLTLTTPLGNTMAAATRGQFSTSASGLVLAPTATATPKPKPPTSSGPAQSANPGQQVIINEINAVFGQYAPGALNIARCESGYNPNAVNSYPIGNSHASGVFQILYPSTWNTTSYAAYSPFDYAKNIRAAYEIFHRDGNSWREWACKP